VAKRLADIRKMMESSSIGFYKYLEKVLDDETFSIINKISERSNLYIFSGIIRNYFLGVEEIRDVDIVLENEINIEKVFRRHKIKLNSFGGYKIQVGKTRIDLWYLKNTWAIKQHGSPFDLPLEQYIPYTAFFNFSAIVFSYNEMKFYCHKAFLSFLRDKRINYLYEPNANSTLCIVNTFYYSDKYQLKIANKLIRYVIKNHKSGGRDYELIQKTHFGKILYTKKDLDDKIINLSKSLERVQKEKRSRINAKRSTFEVPFPPWPLLLK